jgi:antirestriction protein ArdC
MRSVIAKHCHVSHWDREIPFLKSYTVFNVEQIRGLSKHYYAKPEQSSATFNISITPTPFFAATQADVRYRGGRAYYAEEADYIQLPPIESFRDAEGFYATFAHETSVTAESGLGRKVWGDEGYAREELVAELGAAFLCADLEIKPEVQEDHASYIATWLQVLKNDTCAIFQAAAFAQRAVDYLHGLQAKQPEAAA